MGASDSGSIQGARQDAAVTLALVAFSVALTAAFNGVMRPDDFQLAMFGMLVVSVLCALVAAQRLFSIRRAGG